MTLCRNIRIFYLYVNICVLATVIAIGAAQYDYYEGRWDCGYDNPCREASSLNPNPYDCCSFYNCHDCRAFLQPCGPGTVFEPLLKVCVHMNPDVCPQMSCGAPDPRSAR